MPQISVIVPVYKVEKYINRCVDSILAQTFTDFELILVDDGSPDNCGAICDEYAAKDSRVRVIHQKNGGLSAARNAGIDWVFANSDSEWIAFVDSDDWIHPMYLDALFSAVSQSKLDVAVCGFGHVDENGKLEDDFSIETQICKVEQYYCEHQVEATVAWNKLYNKACFEKIRYPLGRVHEDEFTTYRIIFHGKEIAVVQQALYAYFQRADSIMGHWKAFSEDAFEAYRGQLVYFKKNGYRNAYAKQINTYCTRMALSIYELQRTHNDIWPLMALKLKLKMVVLRNASWYKISGNERVYKVAFPFGMELYWIIKAQISKIIH